MAVIAGDGGTTVVIIAEPGAGGLSQPSALGLEGGWTPTLVVVISATVVNTGAGKKTEKKNSLDGSASTRRTVAVVVGDGGTTVVDNAKLGAGGLSWLSALGLEGGWTPTLVVVVPQSSTLGLERKRKRKTYLMVGVDTPNRG